MVRNIKLIIAYDGTNYNGWQSQLNGTTIQETIEQAAYKVMKQKINLIGSGRTDGGVHALGQVANFTADTRIDEDKIKIALNANLPHDIRIIDSVDVPLEFNSRFDAHDKTYMYQIYNDRVGNPFYSKYSCFVPSRLDVDKMGEAFNLIVGTHDFKGFMAAGSHVKTTIRTVYDVKLVKDKQMIKLYVTGSGFLYNMVRIIAGTLIDIGKGKLDSSCIEQAFKNYNRTVLGHTSGPEGLFLVSVNYKKVLDF
ncbi:MAG: tRNA pseudouridine(38-40) synthase TruA [Sedimentibacter sp.]|uniref:tRNA pseudouridine(38-40) synthase TruA n=1 Tax=Sedimentibacter sp. TaxID=1960295 RepID=UPI002982804A|nr:tRNA pseudouridine(38-40) synthase TruA [Sedimentibacter sp.]MDW5298647.1 tRNA pseudouridine(38-40) synthase TruA [Sedimentibacter sp.]